MAGALTRILLAILETGRLGSSSDSTSRHLFHKSRVSSSPERGVTHIVGVVVAESEQIDNEGQGDTY